MSVEKLYEEMKAALGKIVPEVELRHKAELAYEINRLKEERDAVILGHNYMEPALFYSVPDFKGDSLELCRHAARTDKDPIVFCGVRFMAETAKILNPDKTVLLPAKEAGCSLAASITAEDVRALKERFPGVPVVVYVNTYADVKADRFGDCVSFDDFAAFADVPCRKLVILDTCHSGAIQQPLRQQDLKAALRSLQHDLVFTMTASEGGQEAVEERERKLGRFTARLLEALEGVADDAAFGGDQDGIVTLNEAIRYVSETVTADSETR